MARKRLDVQGAVGKKGIRCRTSCTNSNEVVEQEETIIQMAGEMVRIKVLEEGGVGPVQGRGPGPGGNRDRSQGHVEAEEGR